MKTLSIGALCSFSFMEFNEKDPLINTNLGSFNLKLWPIQYRKYGFCVVLEVLNKDKIYILEKERYISEKHQPYFCYFMEEQKKFICLHEELKEFQ